MTHQQRLIKHLSSLIYKVDPQRELREIEGASFGSPEIQILIKENGEADNWAKEHFN